MKKKPYYHNPPKSYVGYNQYETDNPDAYPNRVYVFYFMANQISSFFTGFNQACRWLYDEQDKYNPKYCDLYFKPNSSSSLLIKVNKQF